MLDFLAAAWNWSVPLWGASWWWLAIIGAVAGIVLDVLVEADDPLPMAMLGAVILGGWPLVIAVGVPIGLGILVWVTTWFLKDRWDNRHDRRWLRDFRKRKAVAERQTVLDVLGDQHNMTVESEELYLKDDLR